MHHAEELESTTSVESAGAAVSGEHEIEIDADDMHATGEKIAPRTPAMSNSGVDSTVMRVRIEEETFELSDDEIQPAEAADRPSLLPNGGRHRPPLPPSMRPRPAGASSAPPARPSGTLWAATQSAAAARSRIVALEQEADDARWQLANRTLELKRLKAHCAELESQLTERERQVAALERRLAEALGQNGTAFHADGSMQVAVDVSETATLEPTPTPSAVSVVTATNRGRTRELPSAPATVPSATVSSVIKSQGNADETPLPGDADELFTPTPAPSSVHERGVHERSVHERSVHERSVHQRSVRQGAADAAWTDGTEELRRISGINPVIAQTLRAQGVTRLTQIAAWSDDDIRRIAKAIKVPKSRISRGRWVQKARDALMVASGAELSSLTREEEAPASTSRA